MKKYEIESLLKSFFLFFISLSFLLGLLFYFDYHRQIERLKNDLFAQMRLCTFDLECPEFKIDFEKKNGIKPMFLYEKPEGLVGYFEFLGSKENLLSITYSKEKFKERKFFILRDLIYRFLLYAIALVIFSLLFSFYALYPMRRALFTIEEFIKDVLHDVNTPITTIALNSALLDKSGKDGKKIEKINQAIKRIFSIQDNLKSYLEELPTQIEEFDLRDIIMDQKSFLSSIYPQIHWYIDDRDMRLETNKKVFARIITNILSNAAKYNKKYGSIKIYINTKSAELIIEDTGIGIKDPSKIFDRFYKEGERGTGVGLNIVKKLANELKIGIKVTSKVGVGTTFKLDLRKLIKQ